MLLEESYQIQDLSPYIGSFVHEQSKKCKESIRVTDISLYIPHHYGQIPNSYPPPKNRESLSFHTQTLSYHFVPQR